MKKFIPQIVIFSRASLFFKRGQEGVANKLLSDAIEFILGIFIRKTT
jgi:hypothetical protein